MRIPLGDTIVDRRTFLKQSAFATVAVASGAAPFSAAARSTHRHEDDANQHNMLAVGEKTIFLSHLPMFQHGKSAIDATGAEFTSPHRFQVILEASLVSNGSNVDAVYVKDRQAHAATRIYTLEPAEVFVLSHLFTPDTRTPQLREFPATMFRGHLEQGGVRIPGLDPVQVNVKRVVHARRFDPTGSKPANLEYILFGSGGELFLSHAIFAPPDFDQVLAVSAPGRTFTPAELMQDLRVVISGRKNVAGDRLREGQKVDASLIVGGRRADATPIVLQTGPQFYFEEGELLAPPTFTPTLEERRKDSGPVELID